MNKEQELHFLAALSATDSKTKHNFLLAIFDDYSEQMALLTESPKTEVMNRVLDKYFSNRSARS